MKHLLICVLMFAGFQLTGISCRAQVLGCTDPQANNFDSGATVNDGSCTYDPTDISYTSTYPLDENLKETSGLILWDGNLWTHNDNEDLNLYGLGTPNPEIERTYHLDDVENISWEEIAQDEAYIYLGDFGNNSSGNRTDLYILRVAKNSLKSGSYLIDTIWFSYADQDDLSPTEPNMTDFDCEAFVVSDDSIFLFTKQWISNGTTVYRLPKIPGTYQAVNTYTYNTEGMVTGVTWMPSKSLMVLCGYTSVLNPFLYLLYDYQGNDFFSGNRRRVGLSLPFHQIEGIATDDGLKFYVSNEAFALQPVINTSQKLHIFELDDLLREHLVLSMNLQNASDGALRVYPNPASAYINVEGGPVHGNSNYKIFDSASRMVMHGVLSSGPTSIPVSTLLDGFYTIMIEGTNQGLGSFIKL